MAVICGWSLGLAIRAALVQDSPVPYLHDQLLQHLHSHPDVHGQVFGRSVPGKQLISHLSLAQSLHPARYDTKLPKIIAPCLVPESMKGVSGGFRN